jgi:hypothetical protein
VQFAGRNDAEQADWISYEVFLVNRGTVPGPTAQPVHRQIMDGQRGLITESEFKYVRGVLTAKLRAALDQWATLDDAMDDEDPNVEADLAAEAEAEDEAA